MSLVPLQRFVLRDCKFMYIGACWDWNRLSNIEVLWIQKLTFDHRIFKRTSYLYVFLSQPKTSLLLRKAYCSILPTTTIVTYVRSRSVRLYSTYVILCRFHYSLCTGYNQIYVFINLSQVDSGKGSDLYMVAQMQL